MAQDIVSGLFGLSPYEAQQQADETMRQRALEFSKLDPLQIPAYMAGQAGGMFAKGIAESQGMVLPQVAQAEARQQALQGLDLSSSQSILAKAATIQDPQLKMKLMLVGQQRQAEERKALGDEAERKYKAAQALKLEAESRREMSPFAKIDPKDYTQESVRKYMETKNPSDLVAIADKPADTSDWKNFVLEGKPGADKLGDAAAFSAWRAKDTAARNPATTVAPKIEVKLGESTAAQVGPMLKESKTKAQGAVNMYDIADRIDQAIATGNVISGPLASTSIKVRQVFDPQGKSKTIQDTRKVIRALAEGTVNARKALEGQGSITEQESAVAAKAESGDIDDLTIGELQIISDLNKRAARIRMAEHNQMLTAAESDDATKNLAKYFKVKPLPAEKTGASKSNPIPASKAALVVGTVYDTPRGKAKWNGSVFEAQ